MRRRRTLSAGFVVRMEDTRRPMRVMFGTLITGAGSVEGGGEECWKESG